MMPVMSGIEFYEALQEEAPQQAAFIVFLTGGAFSKTTAAFLDSVLNPHLEKPFDVSALKTFVNVTRLGGRSMSDGVDLETVHRLKNQLAIILGFCELLLADTPPDDQRRADLLQIQTAGRTAIAMLREPSTEPDLSSKGD